MTLPDKLPAICCNNSLLHRKACLFLGTLTVSKQLPHRKLEKSAGKKQSCELSVHD